MSQVSDRPLKKDLEEKIRLLFCESVVSCSSAMSATELLEDLLTPTEQIMLAKRIAIAHLLIQKKSYDQIKSLLHVSTPTIGTVSRLLKVKGSGLRATLKSVMKHQSWKKFFRDIDEMTVSSRIFSISTQKSSIPYSTSRELAKIST